MALQYARYASTCFDCGKRIQPGDAITIERRPRAAHFACRPVEAPKPATPAAPVSVWEPFKNRETVVRFANGQTATGMVVHVEAPAIGPTAAIDCWQIRLTGYQEYRGMKAYFLTLRDRDEPVGLAS